jgi:hypothetical protein
MMSPGIAPRAIVHGVAAAVLATLAAGGCARVGPPGGGPEDTTPPEVLSTQPAAGATGVPVDTVVRIEFSEDMNRVAVERAFSLEPEVDLKNLAWDGRSLVVRPESDLPDSTTFVASIASGVDDSHGVGLEGDFSLTFSTGPTIDTGIIAGEVTRDGRPVEGATVWACRRSLVTEEGAVWPCRYSVSTGPEGTFRITGVAVSERPYVVLGFVDADEDDVYSVNEEEGVIADVVASISEPGDAAEGIKLELMDASGLDSPTAPGEEELWNSRR